MAITRAKKDQIVARLVEAISASQAVYLVNYEGMKVEKDNALRKSLNLKKIPYIVAKNTLIKRALAECNVTGLDDLLKGVSAVILGDTVDPILPAKEIVAFLKDNNEALKVKSINLDGDIIKGEKIVDVSKMPGRKELIGQVVAALLGPGATLVGIFKGPGSTVAGQVKALVEKLEEN